MDQAQAGARQLMLETDASPVVRRFACEVHSTIAMRRFQQANYAAAERAWTASCSFSPSTYDGAIGRGLSIAASNPNRADEIAETIIPQIPRIGDRVLRCDLAAVVGDAYFAAGRFHEARDYYAWSMDIFSLPKLVNTHAQRGLLGLYAVRNHLPSSIMLGCFAIVLGYYGYRVARPLRVPEYYVGGNVTAYTWPSRDHEAEPAPKVIYLRGSFPLAAAPKYAWLRMIGQDTIVCYVNGRMVTSVPQAHSRSAAGSVLDITSFLRAGGNVIAIECRQSTIGRPPAVSVDGEIVFFGGHVRTLNDPRFWKICDHAERRGNFWYAAEFDDEHWRNPNSSVTHLVAQVAVPPAAITTPPVGNWISPPPGPGGERVLMRRFVIDGHPHSGWLRFRATGPARVAVNSVEIASDNDQLAGRPYLPHVRTILDISSLLRSGENQLAIMIATPGEEPHLQADLGFTFATGPTSARPSVNNTSDFWNISRRADDGYFATDASWLGKTLFNEDWRTVAGITDWQPARVEKGTLGMRDSLVTSEVRQISLPLASRFGNWLELAGYMLVSGFIAAFGAWCTTHISRSADNSSPMTAPTPLFALLLPTVAAAAAFDVTFDPAIGQTAVYQPFWLVLLWASVLLQWAMMFYFRNTPPGIHDPQPPLAKSSRQRFAVAAFSLLVLLAAWLRIENIIAEPIHHDEVSCYELTMGVLEYGFPGGSYSQEMPFGWCATSELVYYFMAPFALLFDDPLLILRVPSVCWSLATLLLIFYVGRRLFGLPVAIVASVLYSVSPYCIGMANFGRYFSQLQFFGLLTSYLFYRTIEGGGPINRTALWGTAFSFIALYLSWEGAGLIAPAMILAALLQRRGRMKSIICCPSIYAAIVVVGLVVMAQDAHRVMQQTQRLWIGSGISDLQMAAMWRLQLFEPEFYFMELSWIKDGLLPLLGICLAIIAACRSRYQYPLRVFLIIMLGNCGMMTAVLPLRSGRYTYHLIALAILCASVGVVSLWESARGVIGRRDLPTWQRRYVNCVGVAVLSIFVVLTCGQAVMTTNLHDFQTTAFAANRLRFNDWDGPVDYLRKHYHEGDIVIASLPHAINHTIKHSGQVPQPGNWQTDYWLQTTLVLQATLSDNRPTLLDRRSGVEMIYSQEGLEHLFAKPQRIWYLTTEANHRHSNLDETSILMRQNMDVVYEDYQTVLLLRDSRSNRTAEIQQDDEDESQRAHTWSLE